MTLNLHIFDFVFLPPPPSETGYEPFVTGSHAYGTPRPDSDIDVVILIDKTTKDFISDFADKSDKTPGHYAMRFGVLNLICCIYKEQYNAWREGTLRLIKESPVSRERAIEVLQEEREKQGINFFNEE